MGYQIKYGNHFETEGREKKGRRWIMTMCFFVSFLWLVGTFWPEGRDLLRELLIPGDPDTTLEAVQVFAQELGCGYSLADAAENFRDAVFSNGFPG